MNYKIKLGKLRLFITLNFTHKIFRSVFIRVILIYPVLFYNLNIITLLCILGENLHDIVAIMLDGNFIVSLNSCHVISFTLGLILLRKSHGLHSTTTVLLQKWLWN